MDLKGHVVHPAEYTSDIKIMDRQPFIIASKDGRTYGAVHDDGTVLVDFLYSTVYISVPNYY